MNRESEKPGALKAWFLAARPKTLSAAAVPVIVGGSLARADGFFEPAAVALCFGFAFLMQICANLINDLIDFKKVYTMHFGFGRSPFSAAPINVL